MKTMKTLYAIACCLFLAAIASKFVAEQHFATATIDRAKSYRLGDVQPMKSRHRSEAEVQIGNRFVFAGLPVAGLGIAAWIASSAQGRREGKRLTPIIPSVLCIAYVMSLLGLV